MNRHGYFRETRIHGVIGYERAERVPSASIFFVYWISGGSTLKYHANVYLDTISLELGYDNRVSVRSKSAKVSGVRYTRLVSGLDSRVGLFSSTGIVFPGGGVTGRGQR